MTTQIVKGFIGDLAVLDHTAGNGTDGGDLVGHADFGMADDHFLKLGCQHTLHSSLDLVDGIVNDAVETHVNICTVAGSLCSSIGTDVEADNDGAGGGSQQNVGLVDSADTGMDNLDTDFLVGDLLQRSLHSLGRTLHVSLDDQVQGLHLALLHPGEEVVQSDLLVHQSQGILLSLLTLLNQFTGHTLVGNGIELVAGSRNFGKTRDLNGNGGTGGLDGAALVVGHDTDTAHGSTGDDDIALLQGAASVRSHRAGNGKASEPSSAR